MHLKRYADACRECTCTEDTDSNSCVCMYVSVVDALHAHARMYICAQAVVAFDNAIDSARVAPSRTSVDALPAQATAGHVRARAHQYSNVRDILHMCVCAHSYIRIDIGQNSQYRSIDWNRRRGEV